MTKVTQTGLSIAGHEEENLKVALDLFCANSAAASVLLTQAGSGVDIASNSGLGDIHADGNTVKLFWQKKLRGGGATTLAVEEVVESALFEIKNAVNRTHRDNVTMPLKDRCLHFGNEFSRIEAESTFTIATILKERSVSTPNYTPSIWGGKQVNAVGNKSLTAFQPVFMADVHDPNGIGTLLLKSKHLYAHDRIPKMYNARNCLRKMVTIGHRAMGGQPTSSDQKFGTGDANTTFNGFKTLTADQYQLFIWLIYAILAIEQERNWTVAWKDSLSTALYLDFVDDVVRRVGAVQKDPTKIQTIKQKIMALIG